MIPYVYSVIGCRDGVTRGEQRNIGLLVASPTEKKAWLRRGDPRRASLADDVAVHVAAWLDLLEEEAQEVARTGAADGMFEWMRRRAAPTEDTVTLGDLAIGVTGDLDGEMNRLQGAYVGPGQPSGNSG